MLTIEDIYRNLLKKQLEPELIQALVDLAISEDLVGGEDLTSLATIPETQISYLDLVTRKAGVISGIDIASLVFLSITNKNIEVKQCVSDGLKVEANTCVLTVKGSTVDLLSAERTALNFLGHLSGISTLTNKWVTEISGSKAKIRDTRKTTPGLRVLEKYAVRAGGGLNHRMTLNDQVLIKDNHIVASNGIKNAIDKTRDKYPELTMEIEVDNLTQFKEALENKAEFILLDNFDIKDIEQAVKLNNSQAKLEASGGITIENAAKIAATGVDFLAVGSLTHSAPVLDIGGDLRTAQ